MIFNISVKQQPILEIRITLFMFIIKLNIHKINKPYKIILRSNFKIQMIQLLLSLFIISLNFNHLKNYIILL